MEKMTAEQIAKLLLGGDVARDCVAVMVDSCDWVGYISEEEDGYEDRDKPLLTACHEGAYYPFMEISLSDLEEAEMLGDTSFNVYSKKLNEWFVITPLTPIKLA